MPSGSFLSLAIFNARADVAIGKWKVSGFHCHLFLVILAVQNSLLCWLIL